ncbi:hypothetical protein AVEN_119906-1 [Araneus ventricosus]|uniref:Uncharacterized protein n=1 Tax=Araneus ventricosus TaxID=182803 RepID=A0A4Y2JAB6_ARAVE|nr:hypothetical protein AVEN_119906-1 [Araneus ventricosus]
MQKEEYEEWTSIDKDIPVAATITELEICQAVCKQDQATKVDDSDGDECVEENPPTNAEMRQALDILKRGVQHRSTNFKKTIRIKKKKKIRLLANTCKHRSLNWALASSPERSSFQGQGLDILPSKQKLTTKRQQRVNSSSNVQVWKLARTIEGNHGGREDELMSAKKATNKENQH